MSDILTKYKTEISKFCRANGVIKLSLFGSYKKNTYNKDSDIDLLVEFENGTRIGFLDIARMERELSEILKMKVDLRTPEELSKYFRNSVIKEAEPIYNWENKT
jgi:predicted nucleotidyltransferase